MPNSKINKSFGNANRKDTHAIASQIVAKGWNEARDVFEANRPHKVVLAALSLAVMIDEVNRSDQSEQEKFAIKTPLIFALAQTSAAYTQKVHNASSNIHREFFDTSVKLLHDEIASYQKANPELFAAVERYSNN